MNRSAATRYLAWLSTLLWIGLAATGVLLFFFYRPSAQGAEWFNYEPNDGVVVDTGLWPTTFSAWLQDAHLWLGVAAVLATVVLAIASFLNDDMRSSISIAGLVLTVATFATGLLLPWDALALVAVTTGTDVRGYLPLWSGEAVFVLIGNGDVSLGTMQRWVIVHIVLALAALAVAVAVLAAIGVQATHRKRAAASEPSHS